MKLLVYFFVLSVGSIECNDINSEKTFPTSCHVCKHTVDEFLNELSASNSKDVFKLGQVLQSEGPRKTIVYKKSELRLIEALENTCKNLRDYKVHKDRQNHLRYSKDESATFKTLNKLRERGVKIDLGFPDEMWEIPDAEVVRLKTQCEIMLEEYEEEISEWFYSYQDSNNLYDWLCRDQILKETRENKDCLQDVSRVEENKRENEERKASSDKQEREYETKYDHNQIQSRKIGEKDDEFKNENKDFGSKTKKDKLSERDEL